MTIEMHNSYDNFYSTVFSCPTGSERITRSSSGALPDILHHAVWYNRTGESSYYVRSCRKDYIAAIDSPARLYQTGCSGISGSVPDDERLIRSKHVEQEKMVEYKLSIRNVHLVGHLYNKI